MSAKPEIIRRIEQETGLTFNDSYDRGRPYYKLGANGDISFIFLDDQGLTEIPEAIVGLNCGLTLDRNRITEIPANLGNNGGVTIWLKDNLIRSLPPECLDWDAIPGWGPDKTVRPHVVLDGNPLTDPPPEIVAGGIKKLRSWFATRQKPQQQTPAKTVERRPDASSSPPQPRRESQQRTPAKTVEPGQTKIFLCYRREDTQGFAGRIYDNLASKYGEEHIFRDIDSTPAGIRYSAWIESRVKQCSVMIVLIGNAWLSAKDHAGKRRLDLPKDWVRREIEAALSGDIPVIPVRVQGASMPPEEDLPSSIADLSEFQSAEVTDSRWAYDVGLLIQAIDNLNTS